jgi:hypothetical protein
VEHLQHPPGRDPGPVGRPGDRDHRVPGPEPRGRGPAGHLPARQRHARGPRLHRGPRLLHVRALVRVHPLRGRHGHLLGPQPRARIPELRPRPVARGRGAENGAGRDGRGVGLPVRALSRVLQPGPSQGAVARPDAGCRKPGVGCEGSGRHLRHTRHPTSDIPHGGPVVRLAGGCPQGAARAAGEGPRVGEAGDRPLDRHAPGLGQPGPVATPQPPGLVPALPAHVGGRRVAGRAHRGLRAAVPGRARPPETPGLPAAAAGRDDGDPAVQQRCGRLGGGVLRERVHGPQPRVLQGAGRPGQGAGGAGGQGHADHARGRGDAERGRRGTPRRGRTQRRGRGGGGRGHRPSGPTRTR